MSRSPSIRHSVPSLVRTIAHFWPYLRTHRWMIAGSLAALLAGVVLRALQPWPIKIVFDEVLGVGTTNTYPTNPLVLLGLAGGALVVILTLRAVTTYGHKVGFALVGNRALTRIRADLYRHVHCLPLSFHTGSRRGDLIVRMTGDIGRLKEVTTTALMPLVASVLVFVVMAGLMLWVNASLAFVALLSLPLYFLPATRLNRKIKRASRDQRKREGAIAATASESIHAIESVQALSLEQVFVDAFAGQNKKSLKEGVKIRRLAAKLQGSVQVMTGLSTAAVLFYGGVLVLRGGLTPGELLVFLSYLKAMFKPMQDFAKYSSRLAKASAASERVMELFAQTPTVVDADNAEDAPPLRGEITFSNLSFSYDGEGEHLVDVDLQIPAGQRVAIVGPSGHGKSTLVSLVPRLHDPTAGTVAVDGRDIRDYTLASLRGQISIVLQSSALFAATVAENIALGVPDATDEEIVAAAQLAHAHDFISRLPNGYDTQLGEA
ncbi:MAG: ABC transporter ATP-binding protein/permease, partial [Rhodothermia bacterium]|nr:ABC transporter ATP-binding protein/permease [Rhodothermia bacterium]